jgi:hypothetical protein
VCMNACSYVCAYVCSYVGTYYEFRSVRTFVCIYVRMCICMYEMYVWDICMYAYMYLCMHICMYV